MPAAARTTVPLSDRFPRRPKSLALRPRLDPPRPGISRLWSRSPPLSRSSPGLAALLARASVARAGNLSHVRAKRSSEPAGGRRRRIVLYAQVSGPPPPGVDPVARARLGRCSRAARVRPGCTCSQSRRPASSGLAATTSCARSAHPSRTLIDWRVAARRRRVTRPFPVRPPAGEGALLRFPLPRWRRCALGRSRADDRVRRTRPNPPVGIETIDAARCTAFERHKPRAGTCTSRSAWRAAARSLADADLVLRCGARDVRVLLAPGPRALARRGAPRAHWHGGGGSTSRRGLLVVGLSTTKRRPASPVPMAPSSRAGQVPARTSIPSRRSARPRRSPEFGEAAERAGHFAEVLDGRCAWRAAKDRPPYRYSQEWPKHAQYTSRGGVWVRRSPG